MRVKLLLPLVFLFGTYSFAFAFNIAEVQNTNPMKIYLSDLDTNDNPYLVNYYIFSPAAISQSVAPQCGLASVVDMVNDPNGLWDGHINYGDLPSQNCEYLIPENGQWAVIETYEAPNLSCYTNNYNELPNKGCFVSRKFFDFPPAQSPALSTGSPGGSGPQQFRPEFSIEKPQGGNTVGNIAEIVYKAFDQNNLRQIAVDRFGLVPNSVSLYYSDSLIKNTDGYLVTEEYKNLIQKDLPTDGVFAWDTKAQPEGNNYRIIGNTVDLTGDVGEFVTGLFSIDHSLPTFNVRTDPGVSHGEDVNISVEPSEDLSASPQVFVTQRSYTKIAVPVFASSTGSGTIWLGKYEVRPGFDGPARVEVVGKDSVGNEGNAVLSGEYFSVGIDPPPKPIIVLPLDKDVFATSTVLAKGSVREDTAVVLIVNGKDEYKSKPDPEGNFLIENIRLDPLVDKGVNSLNFTSRDTAGNISESVLLTLKFNFDPEISVLAPAIGDKASASTTIKILAGDKNNDRLKFTYEIMHKAAGPVTGKWTKLAEDTLLRQLTFNTREFKDGKYVIKVTAGDGFAKTEALSGFFEISNFLPLISFERGEKINSKIDDVVIRGSIKSPTTATQRFAILTGEYSTDGGTSWISLAPSDGNFDSFEEGFSVSLADLPEGLYKVLFRARDSRRYYGRAEVTVIIDFAPPGVPEVLPLPNSIISKDDDLDPEVAGVQFAVLGSSEANAEIYMTDGNAEFKSMADENGKFIVVATLREHGKNDFKIYAVDLAGNKSPDATLSVVYNNPPILKFLNPREGMGIGKKIEITWEVRDLDLDPVSGINLSYRKGNGLFISLGRNLKGNKYLWDTFGLPEGTDYELKLEATDGISPASLTIHFSIDNTPPRLFTDGLKKAVFTKTADIAVGGSAEDDLSGVAFVEFSLNGTDWYRALLTSGYLKKRAAFSLKKSFSLEDGKYELLVRSLDAAGNMSPVSSFGFIVDTKPPRIGSFTISQETIFLSPDDAGNFEILEGTKLKFALSMESDTKEAELSYGSKKIILEKDRSSNLWVAGIDFAEKENLNFKVRATDAVGNEVSGKEIGRAVIIARGKVSSPAGALSGARLHIFTFNDDDKSWVKWQSEAYGEINPALSDSNGNYAVLLPQGKYQFVIEKTGFVRLRSSEFELVAPGYINFDFIMSPRSGIKGFIEDIIEKISL